jgi:cysteine desulfurase
VTRVYLDHAATTPMVPEAAEAMGRELGRVGNATSLHGSGRSARRVVEEGREAIAAHLGARPAEVIFTSGGTEADNLAVKGTWWATGRREAARSSVVCSAVEHHAVLDAVDWLRSAGAQVRLVPVDTGGRVHMPALRDLVSGQTAVVSVMWANNEVGALQPVSEVAAIARTAGAVSHSDAVQAVGHTAVDFGASGLDLLSCTAHKLGGPYGIGALLARRDVQLSPLLHGGGQERDIRSGTLDVPAVAGFAAALERAVGNRAAEEGRIRLLRDRLVAGVRHISPDAVVNGPPEPELSLPGIVSLTFAGCEADAMLMLLDASGIDCATGSACSSGVAQASHVLLAMGRSEREARSTLRFSLGHSSTRSEVDALLAALPGALTRAGLAESLVG